MTATTKKKKAIQADANLIASEMFAKVFCAFLECSDEVQIAIKDMAEIVVDSTSTEDEKQAAVLTIADALFPDHRSLGVDLEECEEDMCPEVQQILRQMDAQEAMFSERVNAILQSKGWTQGDLAKAVGVGQPAISMMLSRNCRPQRHTVDRIASCTGCASGSALAMRRRLAVTVYWSVPLCHSDSHPSCFLVVSW